MLTLEQQLDRAIEKYQTYYKLNRKHLKYGNVKQSLEIMRDQIARLEHQIKLKGQ